MARNKHHSQKFASKRSKKKEGGKPAAAKKAPPTPKFLKAGSHKGGNEAGHKNKAQSVARARMQNKALKAEMVKNVGTSLGPPRIIGMAPLNESANVLALNNAVHNACGIEGSAPATPSTIWQKDRRVRMTVVAEPDGNEQNSLDLAKVADVMVLVLDCSSAVQDAIKNINQEAVAADYATTYFGDIGLCITDMTRDLVHILNAQGCPTPVVVLDGLASFGADARRRQSCIRIHQRYFQSVMSEELIVLPLDEAGVDGVIRTVQECKLRQLHWRECRPYLIADHASYDESSQELTFSGYVRGNAIAPEQLIHLTNHGTFQIKSMTLKNDPFPFKPKTHLLEEVVELPDEENRESLQETQLNDTYEEEQAWAFKEVEQLTKKTKVRPGVSEYQAAWYDGEYEEPEDDEDEGQVDVAPDLNDEEEERFDVATYRTNATEANFLHAADVLKHDRMTDEERRAEMEKLRDESAEEMRNPDEVDTPFELPARHRFSKYTGMKSFHTSKWDPNMNLPPDYARIFKLNGYSQLRESCVKQCRSGAAAVGTFVEITLQEVPASVWEHAQNNMIFSALLQHEQKWSTVHFQIRRSNEFDEPIKSKSTMLAHIGFRKFYIQPLFADVVVGDRTKYSRYFHTEESFKLATFYGPISYHPTPIVMFQATSKEEEQEGVPMRLACFGGAAPPNPDLIILKRTVLSGRIATIFTRSLIVKYMFFNDEDVKWFTPVDLYTRLGKRGKIVKAIGSHGLFRAVFNEQVMQHDKVMMDLYKRVFPKWTTVPYKLSEVLEPDNDEEEEDDEECLEDDDGFVDEEQ